MKRTRLTGIVLLFLAFPGTLFAATTWMGSAYLPSRPDGSSLEKLAGVNGEQVSLDFSENWTGGGAQEWSLTRYVGEPVTLSRNPQHPIVAVPSITGTVRYGFNTVRGDSAEYSLAGVGELAGTFGLSLLTPGFSLGAGMSLSLGGVLALDRRLPVDAGYYTINIATSFNLGTSLDLWTGMRISERVEGRLRFRQGIYQGSGLENFRDAEWWDLTVGILYKI